MSTKNLMYELPCTYHGLHKWSAALFEKYGWMNLAVARATTPELKAHAMKKIEVYQESCKYLGLALANKHAATKDVDRKEDLAILLKNNEILCKMVDGLTKMKGGAKKSSKSKK